MPTDPTSTPKLLLSVSEAARALSISERTLFSLTLPRGPLPCVRLRGRVLYSTEFLRRWIAQQEGAQPAGQDGKGGP